jgi:WXG100 family type VII secretion target
MAEDLVQARYDDLIEMAHRFDGAAEAIRFLDRTVRSSYRPLQQGAWLGRGVEAFSAEMDRDVLPAIARLANVMTNARKTIEEMVKVLREAEQVAAAPFRTSSDADKAPVGTSPTSGDSAASSRLSASVSANTEEHPASVDITTQQLRQAMPGLSQKQADLYAPILNRAMNEFHINTPARRNMFLAQIAHESGNLRHFRELGNDAYFQRYEGRRNLGNTQPGDGPKFRGRGAIQITGRTNYESAGRALGLDLTTHPELLEQPENAIRSAAWWWEQHGLNERVDRNPNDIRGVTRVINGGFNGLPERQNGFDRINRVLVAP